MQNYWTSIFNVNGDSLPGPLIIGTFEKRAPDHCSAPDKIKNLFSWALTPSKSGPFL